jgi:GT2 family glycosyltransferase
VDTIRSVLLQDYPNFELLVVDQSARHTPAVERFLRNVEDSRYSYYLVTPPSLPAARNFGLAQARGEIVIYVDDDVLLDPGFIEAHVQAYQRMEQLGALGGRVRYPNETVSNQLCTLLEDGSWKGTYDYLQEAELTAAVGCNMSFRRSALEGIGGFDPGYEGSAQREESDACFRVRRQGYRVRFEPRAALSHLVASAGGCRDESPMWDSKFYYQSETLFHLKHLGPGLLFKFYGKVLRNYLWPLKGSARFGTRLAAFFTGASRGMARALFPKKLQPTEVWKSNQTESRQVTQNAYL